ncbi:MAG TPA: hypothetical protein VMB66_08395 [Candidatus Acidoferrales bacterium]|nr:hypothetical protein [Candidatus Acidoferrales bacterium]
MPPDDTGNNSPLRKLVTIGIAVLGASIGAVWGGIVGARESMETISAAPQEEMKPTPPLESLQLRPFRPELHRPSRPGPDWQDSQPAQLPKPTYAPATLAFGLTLAAAGVVTSFWVSLAGLILFVLGLSNWIGALLHEHK